MAPLAVRITLLPGHIVGAPGPMVTVGVGVTVIVTGCEKLGQPSAVYPYTVYVVLAVGVAITLIPVVWLRPAAGAHE